MTKTYQRGGKSGRIFRWRICCAVSDPAWAVRRGRTGTDEISGGHDDEPRAGDGRIFEENGCFYVQHLVFTLYAMLNSMVFTVEIWLKK